MAALESDRPTLDVPRLDTGASFRKEAYAALKRAITAMDVYDPIRKRSGWTSDDSRTGSGSAARRSARQ